MSFLLWHLVRRSALLHPDRKAVEWQDSALTYRELDDQSSRLAALLRSEGVGPGGRVGFYMPKSHLGVVTMVAVTKVGAAYVPIDPGAPALRATYILHDCSVQALVTTSDRLVAIRPLLASLPNLRLVVLTDSETCETEALRARRWNELFDASPIAECPSVTEDDPAYLLYTSGSTGRPKGVVITHRNALTFVNWAADEFAIEPGDRLSNHAPLHFDLSVFDVYAALKAGACTVIIPDVVALFPIELARWIDEQRISVWYSVPSALTRLVLHGRLDRFAYEQLRLVLYAGEVFPVKHLRQLLHRLGDRVEVVNLFGPTETNVCTFYRVPRPLPQDVRDIPIGKACANTSVVALDESGGVIAPGVEGELLVRGPSVTPGYWGLPDRSREALCRNPFQPAIDQVAYRTGDIVRIAADGNYTFVGRRDHMVKCRGYRIELGEIEQVLQSHESVREAVVVARPEEEIGARLEAVVSLVEGAREALDELRAFCLQQLPAYMVPEDFRFLPELPKTSTGKVDRQRLLQDGGHPPKEAR
jgi:amino acid adenylation domain-containing protein